MKNERIVFMGTPDFAVATLNALVEAGQDVVAVVTAPDKPAGRGRQLRASAVKERALQLGLPVLQPVKLKDPDFLAALATYDAALQVVVAFRMLPEAVWARPPLGTVNLHGSLLPAYRGAAPINWAVANGETRTGVTTFLLQHEIDTGDLLHQESIGIGPDETAGEVHDRLMMMGAQLMVRTVRDLFNGTIKATPQRLDVNAPPPSAPKLNNDNLHIRPDRTAKEIHDLVRGMSPFPGAWCTWTDGQGATQHCKILRTALTNEQAQGMPGNLHSREGRLFMDCMDFALEIVELQTEGRKRMFATDLLRGLRHFQGSTLA